MRVHIYGWLTLWPVTCEYILLPTCMHVIPPGLMSMGVIYDKVDKGSFLASRPHLRSDSGETGALDRYGIIESKTRRL